LISLLIPFGAYLLAEHLHCSGILAAVAAGVTMGYVEQTGQALAVTRVRRSAVLQGLKLPPEPSQQEEEDRARVAAAEAAIQAIEQAQHDMGEGRGDTDLYADAGARIMELYRQRIDGRSKTGEERALARRMDEIERKLRLAGLRAERTELYRIARSRKLSDETARKLVREIDLLEARFATR
jgi:monovalent cation/hydrogen antiporter